MQTAIIQKTNVKNHEQIINNKERWFTDADFPVGSVSHQGDIILVRIESIPNNKKIRKERQVATGNTKGSRHILDGGEIYDCVADIVADQIESLTKVRVSSKYIGPVFTGGLLTHPEHGNQGFSDEMVIAVVYQRNLDAEEKEQIALD